MREHPIPQDVTGYRFHIIGNLTLKQFVEIAGGVVAGIILYKLSLPAILKWPMIAFVVSFGGLGAFVPIAGRSFDQWVITFFKVIYRPTLYYWRREAKIPEIFTYEPKDPSLLFQPEVDLTLQKHQRVDEYLASVADSQQPVSQTTYATSATGNEVVSQQVVQPQSYFGSQTAPTASPEKENQASGSKSEQDQSQLDSVPDSNQSSLVTQTGQLDNADDSVNQDELEDLESPEEEFEMPAPLPQINAESEVTFNQDLPFPTTPTQPNKIVGMVLTKDNDLVPNAIVEVYNQAGIIERAVKSNALGQFFITTPLPNGEYIIKTTKEGLSFEPVSISLIGEIIPPLEIIAS